MVGDKANDLTEISVDEAVLDIDMPDPPAPESEATTHPHRVLSEDDLVGKTASITYNDNLLDLAMHLRLPVQQCTFVDRVLGVACSGAQPFQVAMRTRGTGVVLEWVRCEDCQKVNYIVLNWLFYTVLLLFVTFVCMFVLFLT